ncbi:UbiD family decarboxylase [Microbacterium betulae]|uniref:UbiD family decarboxylase n=1 Tax=Microbacterium betulae TaxID=2981139 RepID=A0AA97FI32_9MICO|nr:UbiD family decarboxylase [Microbacterium sp. AB]WOF22984.1 UbiD family decarboxylase [Microbacterium sp. AB]
MRAQDLQSWFADYGREHPDDVLALAAPVRADGVLTAVVDELERSGRSPVVHAPGVDGGVDVPVLTNVFASRERIARMLGVGQDELHAEYARRQDQALAPVRVDDGAVLASVRAGDDVDLSRLPLLRHFASDLGPYITSGVVVADDPETGVGNLSYHRATPAGRARLALSLHSRGDLWRMLRRHEREGTRMPVAMVIGAHPLFHLAASARAAESVDERHIAGGLLGEPLRVVATPVHGIEVPADAEIVVEGTIDPADDAAEGPFGEFSGYSSDRSTRDVLEIDAVLMRRSPMLLSVTGGRSADHLTLGRLPREADVVTTLRGRFPQIVRVHYPASGTHFHAYVAVDQLRRGEARQIATALLGWDPYLKTVVTVDADIDVTRDADVLWAMAVHMQPERDIFVVGGLPGSALDPSADPQGTTSRLAIDATRTQPFTAAPIEISAEARRRAAALLADAAGGLR